MAKPMAAYSIEKIDESPDARRWMCAVAQLIPESMKAIPATPVTAAGVKLENTVKFTAHTIASTPAAVMSRPVIASTVLLRDMHPPCILPLMSPRKAVRLAGC